jgi:GT2 family glycosyltransferase
LISNSDLPLTDRDIGIVIPTLGTRPDLLDLCLSSIRNAGSAYICVVIPDPLLISSFRNKGLIDQVVVDPERGLAAAINFAVAELPAHIEIINWLGDDDLLVANTLNEVASPIRSGDSDFVFAACDYIDINGAIIGRNRSGKWALWLLKYGPDLVPQPGSLYRRSVFNIVGGLDEELGWTFDLDLFLRFRKEVRSHYLKMTTAQYRWHNETLSTGRRNEMVLEARKVRTRSHSFLLRLIAPLWEIPVIISTNLAGKALTMYSRVLVTRGHSSE